MTGTLAPARPGSRGSPPEVSEPQTAAFRRAILALAGGPCDDRLVDLASDLARSVRSELVGVHVVEVEWSLPLDADIAARSEAAQQILDRAEARAEQLKTRLEPVLLQAREVGAALVDEATERNADLLIVGLPYRKRFGGDFAIGRTVPYVLKHAPCEVWVIREPMPEEMR
ncbi:MAG: universal stress protein [Chloroflexi bacterium]|nr:universal stress protein [Chloroflexota bacterium]